MRRKNRHQRSGAVAVEMAITMPFLFMLILVAVEFGRMNVIRHTVDNAAYEAARRAIVPGATATEVEQQARRIMAIVGARGVNVQLTPDEIEIDTDEINVNVSVECRQNGFLAPLFFGGRRMVGNVTMQREDI